LLEPGGFSPGKVRANNGMLIQNANIITLDPQRPRAHTLLALDGRIVALDDAVPHEAGVPRYELAGRTVVPGFVDSHVHFVWTAVRHFALDFAGVRTTSQALEMVAARVAEYAPGQLILGLNLDNEEWQGALPSLSQLDAVAPEHPVLLKGYTGHLSIVNTPAVRALGLPERIAGRNADGILTGAANTAVAWRGPTEYAAALGWQSVLLAGAQEAARAGITTLHALEGDDAPDDRGVRALLSHAAQLPVRTVLYWQTTHVDAALALGLPRIGGCIWIDGDFSPHTAALKQPYADRPDTRGTLYLSDDRLQAFVDAAVGGGLQVALHCVGDAAVEQVLRAYRRALAHHSRTDHRLRVEHFEVFDDELLRDARELGVSVAIQPAFDGFFGGIEANERFLGRERAQRADGIATFDRHGIPIGGGSDSTVTPLNALYGIHCAVNHSNPAERVAAERALRLYTIDSARLAFEEGDKGTLEAGKLADFAVLDADPLAVPPAAIKDISVRMTVLGGRVTFDGAF